MPLFPASNQQIFPTSFSCFNDEAKVVSGSAITPDYSSTYPYGVAFYQSNPDINNSFEFNHLLQAGTYTLSILYQKGTNRGDLKLEINGVQAFNDLIGYQSTFSFVTATKTITISASGMQNFKFTVFQKQAASSGYVFGIVKMWI